MKSSCLLPVAATLLAACGNHFTPSPRMVDAAETSIDARPGAATLVFIRPSDYAGVLNVSVFIDGKYAADVEASRQVAVNVPPGDHVIVAGIQGFMTSACRQLVASVDAGKIYFIEATVENGADLFDVQSGDAAKLRSWRARTPAARRLDETALANNPIDASEQAECAAKAAEHLADDDPDDRAKHTLRSDDGFSRMP